MTITDPAGSTEPVGLLAKNTFDWDRDAKIR